MAAVKSKKSAKKIKEKVVNSVAPGVPISLNVQEAPVPPTQTVKIDPDKRLEDMSGRLERLFMIQQLEETYNQDKAFLKGMCVQEGAKYVESAHAIGQISNNGTGRYIDPLKFLKLMRKKKIKPENYFDAVNIVIEPCKNFLSGQEINSICITPPTPPAPRFTVTARSDVPQIKLVDAVNALAAEFKPQETPDPVPAE